MNHALGRRSNRLAIGIVAFAIGTAANRLDAQGNVSANTSREVSTRQNLPRPRSATATPTPRHGSETASAASILSASRHTGRKDGLAKGDDVNGGKRPGVFSPWTAFGALSIVIGLILILARLFRKHAPMFSQSLPAEALEILGRRFLDQRQAIVLMRVGSRILVIGSSANGLQPLGEVADPVEVDLLAGLCRRGRTPAGVGTSFLKMLKGQTGATDGHDTNSLRTTEAHLSVSMEPAKFATGSNAQVGLRARSGSTNATGPRIALGPNVPMASSVAGGDATLPLEHELRQRLRGAMRPRREESSEAVL